MQILNSELAQKHSQQALHNCHQLAQISEMTNGILRQYLTDKHKACHQQVANWMVDAGLTVWQDQVGNQWGRLASQHQNAPRLILGSHLDTVPNAGAYDGILGVMLGLELAKLAQSQQLDLPFHLDIVGFADEEGTRFATTLIGSKALAGQFSPQWLSIKDANGISMEEALQTFGLNPNEVHNAALNPAEIIQYWEIHIEQGPVLEAQHHSLGVVSAIAGAKRAIISYQGQTGHAGTTPMNLRRDALAACAELSLAIEQIALACTNQEVATVGAIKAKPGATNVIAGLSEMTLDARAQQDSDLTALLNKIETAAQTIANKRQLTLDWQWTHQAKAVQCAPQVQQLFSAACEINQLAAPVLPSGAGHDAMAIAEICPVGMLFIRSPKGISHHPDEAVIESDVTDAIKVMYSALSYYQN
ncbi:allantoate amidohydrolase [Catenovulum sp. 2E275]|uniref:allantoate amidohydrolase n=1 Tax=Catenovulum sp. 2E275 TaxID=2980497 RepID=UPI0021D2140D|nr:allantoate amidohydrolase [Catenovulum sp. 2E275]MCU4676058.1 allantoate amidohydrolase [Catenovulum sp. 2E275]